MTIKLYEIAPTRSARVRWTLLELDLPFESMSGPEIFQSEELLEASPLGKVPAIKDNGRPLFESSAICTWLADSHPDKGLSYPSGTWERALHDQWVSFAQAELEAHLWSTFRNKFRYPEEKQIRQIEPQNVMEAQKTLKVFEKHLGNNNYMVGDKFTVADIIIAFTLNWSRRSDLLEDEMENVKQYLERVYSRPHCSLNRS